MKSQDIIRKTVQLLSLILFIIQVQESVRKYFEYPVVVQTSRVLVKDLPAPVVYVCQPDQFNFTKSRLYGYETHARFMAGILMNSSTITWTGKDGNVSYTELVDKLFQFNYTTLNTGVYSSRKFIFPHGECVRMDVKSAQSILVITKKRVQVAIVDPSKVNNIRTEKTPDAKTKIGPISETHFEAISFLIDYKMIDDSIHDGVTCTDYRKLGFGYGDCLMTALKQEITSKYGCLPPWVFTGSNEHFCDRTKVIPYTADPARNKIYPEVIKLLTIYEPDMFKKCLPPCVTMQIVIKENSHTTNRIDAAMFSALSKDWATVHTHVYSYNIFSLTVELGSALGLWTGLYSISLLDNILLKWGSLRKYWMK